MKNLVTRISETNYLDILRGKFVEILDYFWIIKLHPEGKSIKNINDKKKNSIYLYTLQFAYYFLTILLRLSKKSQRLKEHIRNLIKVEAVVKYFVEIPLPYDSKQIEELQKAKLEKSTKLVPKLKFYYKLKGVALEIYNYLGIHLMNNIGENIDKMYKLLDNDLKFLHSFSLTAKSPNFKDFSKYTKTATNNFNGSLEFLNTKKIEYFILPENETIKDGYEIIVASFRKSVYKYFLNGIFPIIYSLKNKYINTSEYSSQHPKQNIKVL